MTLPPLYLREKLIFAKGISRLVYQFCSFGRQQLCLMYLELVELADNLHAFF